MGAASGQRPSDPDAEAPRFDPASAERDAYRWLAESSGGPPPEIVYELLERCGVPPSVLEMAVRALGVMHTPGVARGQPVDPTLVFAYARAVYHEAGAAAVPRPDEPPDEPMIDMVPPPLAPEDGGPIPAPSVLALDDVARAVFPRRSRGFAAQLSHWRAWPAYGAAVQALRGLREGLEIARSMHDLQRGLEREADNRAEKTKFFMRLLKRAARRRARMDRRL